MFIFLIDIFNTLILYLCIRDTINSYTHYDSELCNYLSNIALLANMYH